VGLLENQGRRLREENAETGMEATTRKLRANGISVISAREGRFSLEDVFIRIVEQARHQGTAGSEG